jgi:hypothetical protein
MEVAPNRASKVGPTDVLRRYRADRFSRPAPAPFLALREIEGIFVDAVPTDWSWVVASPLIPFGVAESVELVVSAADRSEGRRLVEGVRQTWAGAPDVAVTEDARRLRAQRFYQRACLKVHAVIAGRLFETADGGFTEWTERLLHDRRERILISGAGLDLPALAFHQHAGTGVR